jgi:hypothetical protein
MTQFLSVLIIHGHRSLFASICFTLLTGRHKVVALGQLQRTHAQETIETGLHTCRSRPMVAVIVEVPLDDENTPPRVSA